MLTLRAKSQPELWPSPSSRSPSTKPSRAWRATARSRAWAGSACACRRACATATSSSSRRAGADATPLSVRIRITPEPGRAIVGNDLRLTLAVDPQLIERGGRVEVDTPYGARTIWTPPALPAGALHRIRDCGLPARGERSQGHAFVRLEPDPGLSDRIARALLDRFAAAWTPDAPMRRAAG